MTEAQLLKIKADKYKEEHKPIDWGHRRRKSTASKPTPFV